MFGSTLFCTECICRKCPYGLKCHECNRGLDDHIIIAESCNGDKEYKECPIDSITREYSKSDHADMLREMIRNHDIESVTAFFDHETGPYHEKDRERYRKWKEAQNTDETEKR